ncbi:hypothetical protein RclHR1_01510005 [Rhizophagus clarus]|uniref:Uncharacterized protein n=1 Tax=Rhizophagus clarus TaxID=94130 RepID=A0A2Z6QTI8_9GLOM|nr:hypothetical protein RclHR1_01510005 [Rhizophagus clarus]GET02557.1 hypothetical protein RCL_e2853_RclHR1_01510005 [Rhizophagus clarus]
MSHSTLPLQVTSTKADYYCQGCVHHQKHLYKFKKQVSLNIPSPSSSSEVMASSSTSSLSKVKNNKLSHLRSIHNKWFDNTINAVVSHRHGIIYQTNTNTWTVTLSTVHLANIYFAKNILIWSSFL